VCYQLGDAETEACRDCIYVGIAVDHTADGDRPESWDEALARFYREHGTMPERGPEFPVFEDATEHSAPDAEPPAREGGPDERVRPVFETADASD